MDSVKVIYKISELVLKLSDEDFEELKDMAQDQLDYVHPLKYATTAEQHKLGEHNMKMIKCLEELKLILIDGKPE